MFQYVTGYGMHSPILMGLSAEESKYILEQMLEHDLDRKKTENLVNDVRSKRCVRLNAVAYLTDKLNLRLRLPKVHLMRMRTTVRVLRRERKSEQSCPKS